MNAAYLPFLDALASADVDLISGDIRALLVNDDYAFDETHDYLDDVPAPARLASPVALTSKVVSDGTYSCDSPITFTAPTDGETAVAIILYDHAGGADSARRLICYLDTGYNLPLDLNGNDADIEVDGTLGLFTFESQ